MCHRLSPTTAGTAREPGPDGEERGVVRRSLAAVTVLRPRGRACVEPRDVAGGRSGVRARGVEPVR